MKWPVCLSLLFFFTACSSQMTGDLERRHVHHGLEGEEKSGTVVYNPHGAQTLVESRRREAYGRMVEYCAPQSYKITQEEVTSPQKRDPNYHGVANDLGMNSLSFVDFICVSQ